MSTETIGRKLLDLRVCDLKEELEKRSLDSAGNKSSLVERLQKALKDEGHDPEKFLFQPLEKRTPNKVAKMKVEEAEIDVNAEEEGEGEEQGEGEEEAEGEEEESNGVVVDEVGTVDNEEDYEENGDMQSNDMNTNDNEESINLTIEEDEQKLLHAQAQDDKEKKKTDGQEGGGGDDGNGNGDGDCDNKIVDLTDGKDVEGVKNDLKEKAEGGDIDEKKNIKGGGDEDKTNNKSSSSSSNNKNNNDSEFKSSTKSTTAKDEKDKTAGSKSRPTSSSRNLWVSGLLSATRASDLKTLFSKYGKVIGAKVVTNTRTPGTRCYGYVTMASSADASKCIDHLHRTELHGRIISVERTKSEIGNNTVTSSLPAKKDVKPPSKDRRKSEEKENKDKDKIKDKKTSNTTDTPVEGKKSDVTVEKTKSETSTSRRDRKSNTSRDRTRTGERRRSIDREREILSFQKIREERERQRLREKERELREEDRRRRDIRRRQREEEQRLAREREKLQLERERLEREKAELLRLERERQKLEREKIELERLELKQQQMKIMQSSRIEDSKRTLKRATDDRYSDTDRKRSTNDRRFEAPPPPRFDAAIASYERSSEKKRDEYTASKRDDYKRDIDIPRHTSSYHGTRESHKERYVEPDPRSSSFRRGGGVAIVGPGNDERDASSIHPYKSRHEGSGSKRFDGPSYGDRSVSGGGSQWQNAGPPVIKSFAGNSIVSAGGGGAVSNWQAKSEGHWRPIETAQDRYDRTYNERSGPYVEQQRPGMFVGRPQDRYGGPMSSRYENGKY